MGKIYCIIGKSGTGKDTVLAEILKDTNLNIEKIVPYTTRPKREGEEEGVNYHFVTDSQLNQMIQDNLVIEKRSYNTVNGIWNYFTASKNIDDSKNYIIITTQKALDKFFDFFGNNRIHVIYLYLDDKTRLERCIMRESNQASPNYTEVCRRFVADEDDYDEEIIKTYKNYTIIDTKDNLTDYTERIKNIINQNN